MKLLILLLALVLVCFLCMQFSEGFTPYGPYQIGNNTLQNALGNAPPGVNALPGAIQYKQNAGAASVDHIKPGNPQNVWDDYKIQP